MNRDALDARHAAVIRRHARSLADSDGKAGRALLDDLAAIADEHAQGADSTIPGRAVLPPSEMIPVPAESAAMPPGSPGSRTRTRTRGGAK